MNVLDLFSGSGELGRAFAEAMRESIGVHCRTVAYCERADYPRAVLLSRMLRGEIDCAPIHDDITGLVDPRAHIDAIVGGWPCQGNSLAGSRKGMEDERSGLVVEVVRLVRDLEPSLVFLENVPGVLTAPGDGVGYVLTELARLGYDARWTDLSAGDVGQGHERTRFWLMAYRATARFDEGLCGEGGEIRDRARRTEPERLCGLVGDSVFTRLEERSSQQGDDRQKQPSPERTGLPMVPPARDDDAGWEQVINLRLDVEPTIRRVAPRMAYRADRIRVIGNGVDYVAAKAAAKALIEGI